MVNTPWVPVVSGNVAAQAADVAREVASRMRAPEQVRACAEAAARQSAFPDWMHWRSHEVAQGDAGLALFYGYLDDCSPGSGWDDVARDYLVAAARSAEQLGHRGSGLFSGIGGIAFAADALSRGGTRYRRLLAELDRWLVPTASRDADSLATARTGVSVGAFDAISGLAGTGAYLLRRKEDPAVGESLRTVLPALVALSGERDGVPNWHTPIEAMFVEEPMAQRYPFGALNCGLAHGIPGPLALLSLALREGITVAGQREAVAQLAGWLAEHRADDEWGVCWPDAFALPAPGSAPPPPAPTRSAWCYGSPGVARALWLAGSALEDDKLCALAVEAMAATYRRPQERRGIDSATFCHGVAGLLQITLRFANDTGDPLFTEAATELTGQLVELYEPDRPIGFYNLEPGGNRVDQPGLLDGAPGVALTLLAATTDVPPAWDRLFLLS
jgi:lantibiotic modifying enzyme